MRITPTRRFKGFLPQLRLSTRMEALLEATEPGMGLEILEGVF
jgi:hypothetical protein